MKTNDVLNKIEKMIDDKIDALTEKDNQILEARLYAAMTLKDLKNDIAKTFAEKTEPNKSQDSNLFDRGIKAAVKMLEAKGYEVVDDDNDIIDIVAYDGPQLVFVKFTIGNFDDLNEEWNRADAEERAITYLQENPQIMVGKFRFDTICMKVVGDSNRAMVRHHINCLGDI